MYYVVTGQEELTKALREIRDEMQGAEGNIVASALRKAAKDTVLESMKRKASQHRDTGTLYNSLKIRKHPNPQRWSELVGVGVHRVGTRSEELAKEGGGVLPWYAPIVEYGGHGKKHPLKGFMRQSAEENGTKFKIQFGADLGAKIERVAKKIGNKNAAAVGAKAKSAVSTKTMKTSAGTFKYKVYRS